MLIKSHLEALDLFQDWCQIERQCPVNEIDKPVVESTTDFVQVCII